MRSLSPRPLLPQPVLDKLSEKAADIDSHLSPPDRAEQVFDNSRGTVWFHPVIEALSTLAGIGSRCMLCSGSEASQVEHFRPKRTFPDRAMSWKNFLWACGICNQNKGNRFPVTALDETIINPIDDTVWDHFFIDEFGNLSAKWDVLAGDLDQRAILTIEEIGLDRETLQETRLCRIINLHQLIAGALLQFTSGYITKEKLRELINFWISEPYQPDVADYFFRGPGRTEKPFAELLAIAEA